MDFTSADTIKATESRSADMLDSGRNHKRFNLSAPFEQFIADFFKPLAENNCLHIHIILKNSTSIIAQIDAAANLGQTTAECDGF